MGQRVAIVTKKDSKGCGRRYLNTTTETISTLMDHDHARNINELKRAIENHLESSDMLNEGV